MPWHRTEALKFRSDRAQAPHAPQVKTVVENYALKRTPLQHALDHDTPAHEDQSSFALLLAGWKAWEFRRPITIHGRLDLRRLQQPHDLLKRWVEAAEVRRVVEPGCLVVLKVGLGAGLRLLGLRGGAVRQQGIDAEDVNVAADVELRDLEIRQDGVEVGRASPIVAWRGEDVTGGLRA